MKNSKTVVSILLALVLVFSVFSGCGKIKGNEAAISGADAENNVTQAGLTTEEETANITESAKVETTTKKQETVKDSVQPVTDSVSEDTSAPVEETTRRVPGAMVPAMLSPIEELKIKQAYVQRLEDEGYFADDEDYNKETYPINIYCNYLGTYNGYRAVEVLDCSVGVLFEVTTERVGEYLFYTSHSGYRFYLYKDSELISFRNAYAQNLLSSDDWYDLQYRQTDGMSEQELNKLCSNNYYY